MSKALQGKIAVVTGASRGVGKGIALSLGEAGATVYVTGRTAAEHAGKVPLAGTVDETAAEVTALGGKGIAVRCDHRDDAQTEALFERVKAEQGGLDILVNSAWAGYEGLHDGSDFPLDQPFWGRRLSFWDDNAFGVRAAYIASVLAIRMMIERKQGLIACISSYVGDYGDPAYFGAKVGTDRLAADLAPKLREHNITSVSLYPGLVRTEGILKYAEYMDLSNSESAQFTGRGVVALAAEYGFTDVDGTVRIPTWKK